MAYFLSQSLTQQEVTRGFVCTVVYPAKN